MEIHDSSRPIAASTMTRLTPLRYFAEHGNEEMTWYLLGQNVDVNIQDSNGTTALMAAIKNKHEAITRYLLFAGARILISNNENESALKMFCADHNFTTPTEELFFCELRKQCSTSEEAAQAMIDAHAHSYQYIYTRDPKIIEFLLERKNTFSVDAPHPFNDRTPVHEAIITDDVDMLKVLLNNGANFNAPDCQGSTPLYYIYKYSIGLFSAKIELLKILLNVGASATSCNKQGLFQLSPTLMKGSHEAIRVVLESNIDFKAKDRTQEKSVIHFLAMNKNARVIDELKPHIDKFDLNVADSTGITPIHVAFIHNNYEMAKFLLNQNVDCNCTDNEFGYTPLYYVFSKFIPGFEKQRDELIELLLQHNAEPQCIITEKNGEQMTLFDAARQNNILSSTKQVIAHLAVLEEHGLKITDTIFKKIKSESELYIFFKKCKNFIRTKIADSVTLSKLLVNNTKIIARYSGNRNLMLKLIRLNCKRKLRSSHPYGYYYNTLKIRISKGIQYRRLVDEVTKVIYEIFEYRFDKSHLVISKVIDFLDEESLQRLYQMSKIII